MANEDPISTPTTPPTTTTTTTTGPPPLSNVGGVTITNDDPLRLMIKNLTIAAALAAYFLLAVYLVWKTIDAKAKTVPDVPSVQAAALGALAVALGAGYASVLGVPVSSSQYSAQSLSTGWDRIKAWLGSAFLERSLLGLGALLYLFAGMLISVTYALNEGETPEVLKTVAIGFGGYVIAYLGAAYQRFSAS